MVLVVQRIYPQWIKTLLGYVMMSQLIFLSICVRSIQKCIADCGPLQVSKGMIFYFTIEGYPNCTVGDVYSMAHHDLTIVVFLHISCIVIGFAIIGDCMDIPILRVIFLNVEKARSMAVISAALSSTNQILRVLVSWLCSPLIACEKHFDKWFLEFPSDKPL